MEDPVYDRLSHTAGSRRGESAAAGHSESGDPKHFYRQILEMFQDEAAKDGVLLKKFCDALENGEKIS